MSAPDVLALHNSLVHVCIYRLRAHIQACVPSPDRAHLPTPAQWGLQATLTQAGHPCIELQLHQRHWRRPLQHAARPHEAVCVHAPGCEPYAQAVVHRQLDAAGPRVGEEIAVMGVCGAEDRDHAGEQCIRAGPPVDGLGGQPQGVDSDSGRADRLAPLHCAIQRVHSGAALAGQLTAMAAAARRHSMRMTAAGVVIAWTLVAGEATVVAGSVNTMNSALALTTLLTGRDGLSTHLRASALASFPPSAGCPLLR